MQRDSRNLERGRGQQHGKGGTGKRVRRIKGAGNSAQGRGHAIKSRPGSRHGMPMADDADAEEAQPQGRQSDARAAEKPKKNYTKTPDGVSGEKSGKKKQTRTKSADETTAKRRAKKRAKATAEETTGGRRPPGTPPGRHTGRTVSTRAAKSTGEAKRRQRTGGGFAGTKRTASTA
jgi:hypothetical protein